jgi:hypothetical protein
LPISKHWEQYGLLRSHFTFRFAQVKQSSAAPPAGALLLRFLAEAASFPVEAAGVLIGAVMVKTMARTGG